MKHKKTMRGSFRLGALAGIDILVHWSFWILLLWIFVVESLGGGTLRGVYGALLVLAVFGCVVLHELGHALTARFFGVGTEYIVLLPIGGVASLEKIPEKPLQELLVAVAGPAVNVVLAVVFGGLFFLGAGETGFEEALRGGSFLAVLTAINVFLVLFNLIPAFPMDGGRMLRALLATFLGRVRATRIAATIGQALAVLFFLAGFSVGPILLLIGVFVFFGALGERQMTEMVVVIEDLFVKDAMMTRFQSIPAEASIDDAAKALLEGSQEDFPVLKDGELAGLLTKRKLLEACRAGQHRESVGDFVEGDVPVFREDDRLREGLDRLRESPSGSAPVLDSKGKLVGLLTMINIQERVMVDPKQADA
ncbi:MAG: site-2 protease family protein [Opitutales bacterium]